MAVEFQDVNNKAADAPKDANSEQQQSLSQDAWRGVNALFNPTAKASRALSKAAERKQHITVEFEKLYGTLQKMM
ncbi:hypothetical protein ABTF70_18685, partial [Acinetobacter baumannii]